jgi:long-chain acyl-CoA synthetase
VTGYAGRARNRPALVVHYLACFKAGLVATPLNYRYTAPEIDHALAVSQARALMAHVEREEDLAVSRLVRRLPLGTVSYGGKRGADPAYDELIEGGASSSSPPPPPSPAAPAVIFFTSGSTGRPKGVTHAHETLGWMFATGAAGLELSPDDLLLAGSSISHVGAFYLSFAALSVGAGVIVAQTFDGDELLPLLREDRPTVLSMLPSALFALTRDHGDSASLRLCRAAGGTGSAELEREFTALSGFVIDEAYGMTEVGLVTVSPPSGRIKLGSVGQVVPAVSLSIRGDDGAELAAGSEGRLWIKTPAATVGYWDDLGATEDAFSGDWLDSGDLMRVDDEGYLGALLEHPGVASAGVIGIHDLVHGENVRAYITLTEGTERPASQELIQFARARIGYKAPEEIVILDEMPLTSTGKLDRTYLRRMAKANLARSGAT